MTSRPFTVTIFVLSLLFLSCSQKNKEDIGFEVVPASTAEVSKIVFDKATLILAIDDSYSMHAKVNELSENLENMFVDLLVSGWDIDLHVVTCSYYKQDQTHIKSADTSSVKDQFDYAKKLMLLMSEAKPSVDLDTKNDDADERCNQSLEKVWSEIDVRNNVNLSLILSNEDDCSRTEENLVLKDIDGSDRNNCAPLTWGRLSAHSGKDLIHGSLEDWLEAATSYSEKEWKPFYQRDLATQVLGSDHYTQFFKDLENQHKDKISNFSHIYLPIVLDTYSCMAESLKEQVENEQQAFSGEDQDFRPRNTVANLGYSYLDVFSNLNQETLFDRSTGDLSLCKDLSHVVNKLQKEIKVRGQGARIKLSRQMDVNATLSLFKDQPILRIKRPVFGENDRLALQEANKSLSEIGLKWVKVEEPFYSLDLFLTTDFINYDENTTSLVIESNRYLSLQGGDQIERMTYAPKEFISGEESFNLSL